MRIKDRRGAVSYLNWKLLVIIYLGSKLTAKLVNLQALPGKPKRGEYLAMTPHFSGGN